MTLTNVRLDGSVTDKATLVKGDALVVTSPDGGEAWVSGESQALHWATVGDVSSVNVEWSCNGGESWIPVAANVENTGSMEWTAPLTATNSALVRVQSSSDPSLGDQSNGRFSVGTDQTVRVVDFTSPWRILDNNSNPGHSWKELSFDDSSWKTVPELDGCRRGRALSPLMDSPGTYSSYLLRHRFSLSQVPDRATLEMFLEDGIVVWLNGTRVFERGVDDGQGLSDWATVDDSDAFLKTKEIEADLLLPGENLLAVLVKQASPGSSLLSFRAAFDVVLTSEAEPQACPSGSPEETGLETGGETSVETAVDSGGGADTSGPSKDHQSCGCGGTTEFPGAWLIGVGAFAGMTRRRQSFSRR
jgi:hypothetical protein